MSLLVCVFLLSQVIAPIDSAGGTVGTGTVTQTLWAFANSPLGVTLITGLILTIVGKILTARPEWKSTLESNKGVFFDAVRYAEKAIPDGSPNIAMQRLDAALKFIQRLEGPLGKKSEDTLKEAISNAHDQAEAKGKLVKDPVSDDPGAPQGPPIAPGTPPRLGI